MQFQPPALMVPEENEIIFIYHLPPAHITWLEKWKLSHVTTLTNRVKGHNPGEVQLLRFVSCGTYQWKFIIVSIFNLPVHFRVKNETG
jgi:hypothetical protein